MDSFTNKAQFNMGFSERLKIKDDAVPAILDLTVMSQHTRVTVFNYVITIAVSIKQIVGCEYLCVFNLNHCSDHCL